MLGCQKKEKDIIDYYDLKIQRNKVINLRVWARTHTHTLLLYILQIQSVSCGRLKRYISSLALSLDLSYQHFFTIGQI